MPMTTLGGTALVVSKLSVPLKFCSGGTRKKTNLKVEFGFWATFGAKPEEDLDNAAEIMQVPF